jgi:hypothetical protein
MKKAYIKAFNELTKLGCPVFIHSDLDGFLISAESENSDEWANYYNTYSFQWDGETINPKIEKVLSKYKLFAEWKNPGCLGVYEN